MNEATCNGCDRKLSIIREELQFQSQHEGVADEAIPLQRHDGVSGGLAGEWEARVRRGDQGKAILRHTCTILTDYSIMLVMEYREEVTTE